VHDRAFEHQHQHHQHRQHQHHTYNLPFHFTNRASVTLRTPKHVFHTFGAFTIAAVVPRSSARRHHHHHPGAADRDREGYRLISDSWYIGAFGKWWRAGMVEAWYHGVLDQSKDEEGWRSGILGIKALDRVNEYNGECASPSSDDLF
jgi:hypothetical protein